ncbi:hypothetical protein BDF19DRAFT_144523 [Syncephalis fuscata]|nr:hypothetical protein BDF19DRAFT_144523 [Syncephalis fuscata]
MDRHATNDFALPVSQRRESWPSIMQLASSTSTSNTNFLAITSTTFTAITAATAATTATATATTPTPTSVVYNNNNNNNTMPVLTTMTDSFTGPSLSSVSWTGPTLSTSDSASPPIFPPVARRLPPLPLGLPVLPEQLPISLSSPIAGPLPSRFSALSPPPDLLYHLPRYRPQIHMHQRLQLLLRQVLEAIY